MHETILIVDDNLDVLECLTIVLSEEGYVVSTATDGASALTNLASLQNLPHLIITDMRMPNMDGTEFRRRQLEIEAIASIPVIFSSAAPVDEASLRGCAVLKKPYDLDKLFSIVSASLAYLDSVPKKQSLECIA